MEEIIIVGGFCFAALKEARPFVTDGELAKKIDIVLARGEALKTRLEQPYGAA